MQSQLEVVVQHLQVVLVLQHLEVVLTQFYQQLHRQVVVEVELLLHQALELLVLQEDLEVVELIVVLMRVEQEMLEDLLHQKEMLEEQEMALGILEVVVELQLLHQMQVAVLQPEVQAHQIIFLVNYVQQHTLVVEEVEV
jgi:hypothetical protein